jgi:hypothetical protein
MFEITHRYNLDDLYYEEPDDFDASICEAVEVADLIADDPLGYYTEETWQ